MSPCTKCREIIITLPHTRDEEVKAVGNLPRASQQVAELSCTLRCLNSRIQALLLQLYTAMNYIQDISYYPNYPHHFHTPSWCGRDSSDLERLFVPAPHHSHTALPTRWLIVLECFFWHTQVLILSLPQTLSCQQSLLFPPAPRAHKSP